jgi:transposase-like protein
MSFPYSPEVAASMVRVFLSLGERERRLYAGAEAIKLGRGGVAYLARLFECDEKTIRRGRRELQAQSSLPPGRSRKKGVAERPY